MPYTKHLPKILTQVELDLIERTASKSELYPPTPMGNFLRHRDLISWKLMFYTGLRPAECYQLKWADIDFKNRKIFVRPYFNKRKNDIPAIMTHPAEHLLREYKELCQNFGVNVEWLFPSVWTWQPISVGSMHRRFKQIIEETGMQSVERRNCRGMPMYTFNLYSLRHSFGTLCWKKTHSDIATSRLMRHTQVQSASIYTHLCHEDKLNLADEVFT